MVLHLPYPPSANRYLRHTARGTYRTAEADRYRDVVRKIAFDGADSFECMSGPVSLYARLHPRLTANGRASKSCLDLDNCIKVVCDALQGVCYKNDRQLRCICISMDEPKTGGGLTVECIEKDVFQWVSA